MPGDEWQRFANVRAFLSYMFGHPGKKLLFMGTEFGQTEEWNHAEGLPWWLLQFPVHHKLPDHGAGAERLYRRSRRSTRWTTIFAALNGSTSATPKRA